MLPPFQQGGTVQMPAPASTFAADVDGLYYFIFWVSVFFFVLITGLLGFAVIKWRRRTEDQPAASTNTHNTVLEVTWTVIPLVLVMIMFVWGWKGALNMTVAPGDCLQYQATAKQWGWAVFHPGATQPFYDPKTGRPVFYVPAGRNVKIVTRSDDVLHGLAFPAFRVKRDVLPGRYQSLWFRVPEEYIGQTFEFFCHAYCGKGHSEMWGEVRVISQADYDKSPRPWEIEPSDPKELGEMVYKANCLICHTIDGTARVGPSFKGLYGKTDREVFMGIGGPLARITVDDEYIKESVRNPNAKLAKEHPQGGMVPWPEQLVTEKQLAGLIEYLKTLK